VIGSRALSAPRRRRHGLYATPPALAGYLVRSVDLLLRTKLGWSAGLADPGCGCSIRRPAR
jgi:hypothetical protein